VDVDLSGNGITKEGAAALAGGMAASPSLAALALDNNDVRDEGGKEVLQVGHDEEGANTSKCKPFCLTHVFFRKGARFTTAACSCAERIDVLLR
jgi:hypothetical protein